MNSDEEIRPYEFFESLNWDQTALKRFWYKDQSIVTHFFNAISCAIPETERFLVKTIKPYLEQMSESNLRQEIIRFITEENTHSLQHTKFNHALLKKNYAVNFTKKFFKFSYIAINKIFTRKSKLALAVCLEHMTAVLAEYGFNQQIMKKNESEVYDLFRWHAFEELNHKSIAFDLYTHIGGGYTRRTLAMLYVTLIFFFGVAFIQWLFIFSDLFSRRGIKYSHVPYSFKFFLGRRGLFVQCFKKYISFYKTKYQP